VGGDAEDGAILVVDDAGFGNAVAGDPKGRACGECLDSCAECVSGGTDFAGFRRGSYPGARLWNLFCGDAVRGQYGRLHERSGEFVGRVVWIAGSSRHPVFASLVRPALSDFGLPVQGRWDRIRGNLSRFAFLEGRMAGDGGLRCDPHHCRDRSEEAFRAVETAERGSGDGGDRVTGKPSPAPSWFGGVSRDPVAYPLLVLGFKTESVSWKRDQAMVVAIDKKEVADILFNMHYTGASLFEKLRIYGYLTGVEFKETKCLSIAKTSMTTKLKGK